MGMVGNDIFLLSVNFDQVEILYGMKTYGGHGEFELLHVYLLQE